MAKGKSATIRGTKRPAVDFAAGPAPKRMTLASIVNQKIYDNCRTLSAEETDSVRNPSDGLTLRDRVSNDVKENRDAKNGVVFGALYYEVLRQLYKGEGSMDTELCAVAPMEGIDADPKLIKAMQKAQGTKPDRTHFSKFFTGCNRDLNVVEVVGICRWAASLKASCTKQLAALQECWAFFVRLKIDEKFPAHWKIVLTVFDTLACELWRKHKHQKGTVREFTDVYRSFMHTLIAPNLLTDVLGCGNDYMSVERQLGQVCSGTELGRLMFLAEQEKVVAQKVQVSIDQAIMKCVSAVAEEGQEVSILMQTHIDEAKATVMDTLEVIAGIDSLSHHRSIQVDYRGFAATIPVKSLSEELDLRFATMLKWMGVDQQRLTPTFAEEVLIPTGLASPHKRPIDNSVLIGAKMARQRLAEAYRAKTVTNSESILSLIRAKAPALKLYDKTFDLDESLCMALTTADQQNSALVQQVKAAFPSSGTCSTYSAVAAKLVGLQGGALWKLSSDEAQKKLQIAMNLVAALEDGRQPDLRSATSDDYTADLLTRCQWWCFVGQVDKRKFGSEAMKININAVEANLKKKGKISHEDTTMIRMFSWLVPDDMRVKADKLVKSADQEGSAPAPGQSASSGSGASSSKASSSKASSSKASSSKGTPGMPSRESVALTKAINMFQPVVKK